MILFVDHLINYELELALLNGLGQSGIYISPFHVSRNVLFGAKSSYIGDLVIIVFKPDVHNLINKP